MEKELCFCIENKELYLEQVLVDFMDIPIFFLCKNDDQYYAALCIEMDELNYIVVQVPVLDVYNLLHEKLSMRNIFLNQKEYWEVFSGEEIYKDTVTKHLKKELDTSLLPEEDACFKVLTEEMKEYVKKFENEYYDIGNFRKSDKKANLDEMLIYDTFDLSNNTAIENFTNLGEYSAKVPLRRTSVSQIIFQTNYTIFIDNMDVILRNPYEKGQWKTNDSLNIAV